MKKKFTLSCPDSIKLLNEAIKKEHAIDFLKRNVFECDRKQLVKAINKCLYDTAQKRGMSLYDLCFNTVPDFEYVGTNVSVTLSPVEFDLVHDDGYWKNKYYALRKRMQEVIDENEDGHE